MAEQNLPEGWALARLGDVSTKPQYGWTCKAIQEGTIRLLRTTDISSGQVNWGSVPFCSEHPKRPQDYYLKRGDILVSRAGSVGKSFIIREDASDTVFASYLVRFKPLIDSEYVYYFMQSRYYWEQIEEKSAGIALPNVNASKLSAIEFPLAPLNEQRRIVSRIEELFSDLEQGEAALRRVQKLLGSYRQAVLKAAVTGELTREWRAANQHRLESGEALLQRILAARRAQWSGRGTYKEPQPPDTEDLPPLPEGWVWVRMEQIAYVMGGLTKNAKRKSLRLKRPMLRVANVYQNRLELDDIHEIGVTEAELERVTLQDGDMLIVEGNGSKDQIGRMAIWENQIPNCIHQNHIIKARFATVKAARYVMTWFMSHKGRAIIEDVASSTSGLHTLSLSKVNELVVPLASLNEAEEIVSRVDEVLSRIDALEAWCKTELTRSATLRQSILKAAFAGKLVPQDPADEPASALLARIQAARAGAASGPKKSARRKSKAKTPRRETA